MEFRLVYEGPLRSGQGKGLTGDKHAIRKAIHQQLVQLWEVTPDLKMRSEAHSILSAPPAEGVPGQVGFRVTGAAALQRVSLWRDIRERMAALRLQMRSLGEQSPETNL